MRLPIFEGPLDLLLRLIEQEDLDITKVALAHVTDQFLAYIATLERLAIEDLVDFLVVAAKLLLIKSQALLPHPPTILPPEEEAGDELVRQLQDYKRFKEIADLLHKREEEDLRGYVRVAPPPRFELYLNLEGVTLNALLIAVQEVLRAIPAPPVGEVVSPITITVANQMELIERHLAGQAQVRFSTLFTEATSWIEVIVTFLALLELIKQDRVVVRQEQLFGEILIQAAPAPAVAAPVA